MLTSGLRTRTSFATGLVGSSVRPSGPDRLRRRRSAQVLLQADSPHPVQQHHERGDGQDDEHRNDADRLGDQPHLAKEGTSRTR